MRSYLHLEDGTIFEGQNFGAQKIAEGEVVFSTGMSGYPQSCTDPSFAGQILVFTYPLIGNYGVPKPIKTAPHLVSNFESQKVWVKGVIASRVCDSPSHHESESSFSNWLKTHHVPGISGIDTRQLTLILREKGVMRGVIKNNPTKVIWSKPVKVFPVPQVSLNQVIVYPKVKPTKRIALIDCGVKHGILRSLLALNYEVTRIPWNVNPLDVGKFDAVFCSNGPGDPKDCSETITNVKKILDRQIPFFGVCLGHQILALAIGADTYKLPYGHRGINQPCGDVQSGKAYITSQNHGFALVPESLPCSYTPWFVNLNDGTNEGIKNTHQKAFSTQFHPEGHPGPSDTDWFFSMIKEI